MISPELKAKELIILMQFSKPPLLFDKANQCALICVNEILLLFEQNKYDSRYEYYQAVKQELINHK